MENQHRKIKGYRELSEGEIALMNEIKDLGIACGELIEKLKMSGMPDEIGGEPDGIEPELRWVHIGATHLQQGLMALTRSVAKPDFF